MIEIFLITASMQTVKKKTDMEEERKKKEEWTFRVGCRLDHHGVVHVAQEELMGSDGGLVAAHGNEGSARGLVVGPYCQQLHCSDSFKNTCVMWVCVCVCECVWCVMCVCVVCRQGIGCQ